MPDRLKVEVDDGGPSTVLALTGELDLTSVDRLEGAGRGVLEEGRDLTLDLAGLTFIDSTGLSALVDLHHAASGAGRTLRLRRVPDHVRRLLSLTRIDSVLEIDGDPPS